MARNVAESILCSRMVVVVGELMNLLLYCVKKQWDWYNVFLMNRVLIKE